MNVAASPTELKPSAVIVPSVLVIGERTRYYRPAPIERLKVESETAHQLRIEGREKGQVRGRNVWQDKAYCLPSDQEWFEVLRRHDRFEEALDELGTYLLQLGSYAKQLAAAGGIKQAPNPLTSTVIACKDPETDRADMMLNLPWWVYQGEQRYKLLTHTPKMLRYSHEYDGRGYESLTSQSDTFCCPDDAAWGKFKALRNTAIAASNHLQDYLKQLGTYQEAKHDGRYQQNGRAHTNRLDEPTASEAAHFGGAATAVEVSTRHGGDESTVGAGTKAISEVGGQSVLAELKVGDRVRTRMNCFGEMREATGIIVPIQTNGTHGRVCLLPDVMPYQMGLEYACPLPPMEQIHSFYHLAYPVNGIHQGTMTVFRTNILEVLPPELDALAIGDFVELYRSESGEALPEQQRRRGEVVQVLGKGFLRVRYRGEQFADKKDQVQRFRKLPRRDPLPYPIQPVQIASRGESVIVTAPDHPCYGETFTVHAISIFGAFREDNTFFYDEELGYRVEDDLYIQPVPLDRDESFTVTLEPGDMVQVLADDDLYEAIVVVAAILPNFEVEVDYQSILFAYPRQELKLYERATPESLAYLKFQHSTTFTEPTLHQRRNALLTEIEQIKQAGPVAPSGAEWKRYRKTKIVGKGDRAQKVTYPADGGHYYTIWHRDAIFNNASGKLVKSLQVGISDSELYNDWQQRFERRRAIKELQKTLEAIERQLHS